MTAAPVMCVSSGPSWPWLAGLAVVGLAICLLFRWILGKQYGLLREHLDGTRTFVSAAIESLRDIRHACDQCNATNVAVINTAVGAATEKILASMETEHDQTRKLIAAIGREEDRTVEAIKGVREAIERNSELLQQHTNPSPILGVGSQVKDSGGNAP